MAGCGGQEKRRTKEASWEDIAADIRRPEVEPPCVCRRRQGHTGGHPASLCAQVFPSA